MQKNWFHMACLVYGNYIKFSNKTFVFRENVTVDAIHRDVCANELEMRNFCQFCGTDNGYRYRCNHPGCEKNYHLYCGYLQGIYYELEYMPQANANEIYKMVRIITYCEDHQSDLAANKNRNLIQQIYLRRYAINHKNIVNMKFEDFITKHNNEFHKKNLQIKNKIRQRSYLSEVSEDYDCFQLKKICSEEDKFKFNIEYKEPETYSQCLVQDLVNLSQIDNPLTQKIFPKHELSGVLSKLTASTSTLLPATSPNPKLENDPVLSCGTSNDAATNRRDAIPPANVGQN